MDDFETFHTEAHQRALRFAENQLRELKRRYGAVSTGATLFVHHVEVWRDGQHVATVDVEQFDRSWRDYVGNVLHDTAKAFRADRVTVMVDTFVRQMPEGTNLDDLEDGEGQTLAEAYERGDDTIANAVATTTVAADRSLVTSTPYEIVDGMLDFGDAAHLADAVGMLAEATSDGLQAVDADPAQVVAVLRAVLGDVDADETLVLDMAATAVLRDSGAKVDLHLPDRSPQQRIAREVLSEGDTDRRTRSERNRQVKRWRRDKTRPFN